MIFVINKIYQDEIMKADEMNVGQKTPEDIVIFAPFEEIQNIHSVIDKLEFTRSELQKVAEGMKPIESDAGMN